MQRGTISYSGRGTEGLGSGHDQRHHGDQVLIDARFNSELKKLSALKKSGYFSFAVHRRLLGRIHVL